VTKAACLAPLTLLLVSCVPAPESYPVPPQHKPLGPVEEIVSIGDYVTAAQPDASLYFARGVKDLEAGRFRWTFETAELKYHLRTVQNRALQIDLGINDIAFRQTGPPRLAIYVNGNLLDTPVYNRPGDYRFEKPVPPSMLKEFAENRVTLQVLNPWQSPDPNVRLGILMFGAGFVTP
jgi:hypothetical protein